MQSLSILKNTGGFCIELNSPEFSALFTGTKEGLDKLKENQFDSLPHQEVLALQNDIALISDTTNSLLPNVTNTWKRLLCYKGSIYFLNEDDFSKIRDRLAAS